MSSSSLPSLAIVLAELQAAVRAGDHFHAHTLAQELRQRIAGDLATPASVEQQVRATLAELTAPAPLGDIIDDVLAGERGMVSSENEFGVVYPVWFGTNRKPTASGSSFTHERHSSTTLGCAWVHVPAAHRFGEIGSSFWKRLRRLNVRDDRLRVAYVNPRDRTTFFAELQESMQAGREDSGTSHALLFLHGYDTTFKDAAIRAAQIGYDLQVLGATAFFSWPSCGSVLGYSADEASIEASEPALTEFLVDFANNCGAEKIHVIAHSMGNRGLLRALQRIAASAETRGRIKFGQFFLAAPDVDREIFLNLAGLYGDHSERTTLYSSNRDLAVRFSAWLHGAPRAGYFTPYTLAPGVDTVAVPNFNVELLGHSYFAQAEGLLHDIFHLMRHDVAPDLRQRLTAVTHEGTKFWKMLR